MCREPGAEELDICTARAKSCPESCEPQPSRSSKAARGLQHKQLLNWNKWHPLSQIAGLSFACFAVALAAVSFLFLFFRGAMLARCAVFSRLVGVSSRCCAETCMPALLFQQAGWCPRSSQGGTTRSENLPSDRSKPVLAMQYVLQKTDAGQADKASLKVPGPFCWGPGPFV